MSVLSFYLKGRGELTPYPNHTKLHNEPAVLESTVVSVPRKPPRFVGSRRRRADGWWPGCNRRRLEEGTRTGVAEGFQVDWLRCRDELVGWDWLWSGVNMSACWLRRRDRSGFGSRIFLQEDVLVGCRTSEGLIKLWMFCLALICVVRM